MTEPDLSSWPTKAAAAAQLKMSVRSLERLISQGEIESQLRAGAEPGSRAERVCNPADIDKLMPAAFVVPARTPAAPGPAPELQTRTAPQPLDALAATLSALRQQLQQRYQDPEPTIWVTLEEAERISGLSQALLKKACSTGLITAVRDKRQWKIHRRDLADASRQIAGLRKR